MKILPFCPFCETEGKLVRQREREIIPIRGEDIPVNVEYYKCESCGEQFEDPKLESDPLEEAYRQYRLLKNMVTPDEMRDFRKQHGLTQEEFSRLLGMGVTTLNRYENGALQTEAHDRILRLVMEPGNLLKLAQKYPEAIPNEKLKSLLDQYIPELRPEEEYSGNLDVHLPKSLHRRLVEESEREGVSLNQYINVALASAVGAQEGRVATSQGYEVRYPERSLIEAQALRERHETQATPSEKISQKKESTRTTSLFGLKAQVMERVDADYQQWLAQAVSEKAKLKSPILDNLEL